MVHIAITRAPTEAYGNSEHNPAYFTHRPRRFGIGAEIFAFAPMRSGSHISIPRYGKVSDLPGGGDFAHDFAHGGQKTPLSVAKKLSPQDSCIWNR